MKSIKIKIKHYIDTYILKVKWIKNMFIPAIIAMIFYTFLDVQCTELSSDMADVTKGKKNTDKMSLLKIFILYFVTEYILKYAVLIFNVHFIAVSMRMGLKNFFNEYLQLRYSDFHKIGVGEAQYNIVRRSSALSDFLTNFVMYFIANVFFFLIALQSGILKIDFKTRIVIIMSISLFIGANTFMQYLRAKLREKVNNGFQKNSNKLYDILLNYEAIVAYEHEDEVGKKYYESMDDQVFYSRIYWVSYEIADAINNLAFILLNVYLVNVFNKNANVTKNDFQRYTVLFTKLSERMYEMSRNIDEIFTQFTNLDQSMIENLPVEDETGKMKIGRFYEMIKARGLRFAYEKTPVFDDVNFEIKKGEFIAITGGNGCGKSTFIKILLGLYKHEGKLEIDGQDYNMTSKKSIRDLISYIPQNSYLFDGTIMDNITVANKNMSNEKIMEYMKIYELDDMFTKLGYDKEVGERGKNLSGGQAQKISFIRAVLKNASIFVLDEATSNMDAKSEIKLIKMLRKNAGNKTVIMIIHNMNVLHMFDRIFFFCDKTLKEQGTLEELCFHNKEFKQFYEISMNSNKNDIKIL